MTVVTADQLLTLRKRPHRTQLRMAIYKPDILFGAAINNPDAALGDLTIPYDGVFTGSYTDVKVGMTLYLYGVNGPFVSGNPHLSRSQWLGRVRVRSISASSVIVAENALPWADNIYIQVVRYVEPWPVYPRQVLNDANVPTWYKDYDIVYTDQNEVFDPVVMMGPNRAATLEAPFTSDDHCHGTARFYFDGSNSYDLNPGGTITSYLWNFYGHTPSTSSSATPGWLTYDVAGSYAVSLTVTNSLGKTSTSWRFLVVSHAIDATCHDAERLRPIRYWGSNNLSGNYQSGGWDGKVWFREDVSLGTLVDGALVIIYAQDWYGSVSTQIHIGGNYPNCEDTVFVGYVRDGSMEMSPDGTSVVSCGLTGLSGRLDKMEGFGVSVEAFSDPGSDTSVIPAWAQLKDITVDIAMNHYLRWHTTIYSIADVRKNGDTQQLKYADFEKGPLYQAIDRFLLGTVLAHACFDAQGQMWMEKKLDIVPVGSRTPDTSMTLTKSDWRDKLSIQQKIENNASYVELGGFYYSGPLTDISTPFISSAPSQVPGYEGRQTSINGLVLTDQNATSQLAGDVYANLNKLYPAVAIPMAGNYRVFDIAPQQRILLTVSPFDNNLNIDWGNKKFIPRQISYSINNPSMSSLTDIVCEEETDGIPGVAGPYPPVEPPGCEGDDCNPPPPCDDCDPPPCTDCGVGEGDGNTVMAVTATKVGVCRNFLAASPNWLNVTGAITGTIVDACLDPYDPANTAYVLTTTSVWKTNNLLGATPTWTQILGGKTRLRKIAMTIVWSGFVAVYEAVDTPAQNGLTYLHSSSNGGGTWTTVNLKLGTHYDGDLLSQSMAVSQHTQDPMTPAVYIYAGGSNAGSGEFPTTRRSVYLSVNNGLTALPQFDRPDGKYCAGDIHIPYSNNDNDDILWGISYFDQGSGSAGLWRHTAALGWINRDPGGYTTSKSYCLIVAGDNHEIIYVLRRVANVFDNVCDLYYSTNEGGAWTKVHANISGASCLGLWPYNTRRLFMSGDFNIWYSSDGGVTLQDKTGDWNAAVNTFADPIQLIPVWVAI